MKSQSVSSGVDRALRSDVDSSYFAASAPASVSAACPAAAPLDSGACEEAAIASVPVGNTVDRGTIKSLSRTFWLIFSDSAGATEAATPRAGAAPAEGS